MNQHTFLYKFLIDPKLRVWRHVALIVAFIIMSINDAAFSYKDILEPLGNYIYLVALVVLVSYLGGIYLSLYVLIPKFLVNKQYLIFACCFFLVAVLSVGIQKGMDHTLHAYFGSESQSQILILDNLSSLFVYLISSGGVTIPIFLKHWMISNQRVAQLEKDRISSQVEQLKEQINPDSLFNALDRIGILSDTDPDKASAMVMKLSQLLRYQLYDCNRDKVLLHSEITFISNFLELEKLYSSKFDYEITTEGYFGRSFIAPLLLFPFVQWATTSFNTDKVSEGGIHIRIIANDEIIIFTIGIIGENILSPNNEELKKSKERLDILYGDKYTFEIRNGHSIENETCLILELDNK